MLTVGLLKFSGFSIQHLKIMPMVPPVVDCGSFFCQYSRLTENANEAKL
ncbi:hypothetical protein D082_15830 [Synechocystis sp. PCC 6714]|nr:hypothetical protein D082_15830 [Synechocystis sp. PCC 6714]